MLLLVIALHCTLLKFLPNEPYLEDYIWRLINPCKENWYTNILFVNNFWPGQEMVRI